MNLRIAFPGPLLATALAAALMFPTASEADDAPASVTVSGFASVIGGRSFGACSPEGVVKYGDGCSTYVADYGYAGVYKPDLSLAQESRVGVQITDKISEQFSATVLVTSRPEAHETLNLDWAYLTYRPSPDWTIQVGRKRLPLFLNYDNLDVGYSINTIRNNILVYGWTVTNYNGASVDHDFGIGDWVLRAELYGGSESTRNNRFLALYIPTPQSVDWNDIVGGTLDFSHNWFSGRVGYMRSHYSQSDAVTGQVPLLTGGFRSDQNFLDIALNADLGNWTLKTELANSDQRGTGAVITSWLASAGYRIGRFTTTLEYSRYDESTPYPAQYTAQHARVYSVAERFDFRDNMDFKIQFDRDVFLFSPYYSGNAVAAGIDVLF